MSDIAIILPPELQAELTVPARRILLVDDHAPTLKMLEFAFKQRGYRVAAASTAEAALDLLSRSTVDLIVADVLLPRVDGFAFFEAVRAQERLRNVPFVMLTGDRKTRSKLRGLEMGADDYITKPCLMEELLARVASIFARRDEAMRIARARAGDLSGRLPAIPVPELLQMLFSGRKSGVLTIFSGGRAVARVVWKEGEIINAEFGQKQAEEALYLLFPLKVGTFEFRAAPVEGEERTVKASLQSILLEGLRRMDESAAETYRVVGGRPREGVVSEAKAFFAERPDEARAEKAIPKPRRYAQWDREKMGPWLEQLGTEFAPGSVTFLDLNQLELVMRGEWEDFSRRVNVLVVGDLAEALSWLQLLSEPVPPGEIRRALRSNIELVPATRIDLGQRLGSLVMVAAPLGELSGIWRSFQNICTVIVVPPGGRWVPPEERTDLVVLLSQTKPLSLLPVGDGTVVEGLELLLKELELETKLAEVLTAPPTTIHEVVAALERALKPLLTAPPLPPEEKTASNPGRGKEQGGPRC